MKEKNYDMLREQYPERISLDQLYRICRISKNSARYLVEHGIIPATDTGKITIVILRKKRRAGRKKQAR